LAKEWSGWWAQLSSGLKSSHMTIYMTTDESDKTHLCVCVRA